MTTFNDIFKSSFLENVTSISLLDMGIALVLSFCLGLFIFMIYKKTFSGVMYSSSFGWVCPHGLLLTLRTFSISGLSRQASITPSPTYPVVPVMMIFIVL